MTITKNCENCKYISRCEFCHPNELMSYCVGCKCETCYDFDKWEIRNETNNS